MSIEGVPYSRRGYSLSKSGPYWPAGEYSCIHDDLCYLLLSFAQDNAGRALNQYVSDDRLVMLQAAVAAGTAVELAAKAALVKVAPSLICERSHTDSLLHLSGKGELAVSSALDIKTIGGLEAIRLCKRLFKSTSAFSDNCVQAVLRVRHAALHAALVHRDELRIATGDSIRIVDQLASEIGADRESFWKGNLELVDKMIGEHQAMVAHIVAAKIQAAKEQIANITTALLPELASVVLAKRSRRLSSSDHEEPVTCPVCRQEAWLICGVEKSEPQPDESDEELSNVTSTAWPFAFECSVCGLNLEESELQEFDFPDEIELEP
jgi:hypothetical protein